MIKARLINFCGYLFLCHCNKNENVKRCFLILVVSNSSYLLHFKLVYMFCIIKGIFARFYATNMQIVIDKMQICLNIMDQSLKKEEFSSTKIYLIGGQGVFFRS